MKNKEITPKNDKKQKHGYWERYWYCGNKWYKAFYHNGEQIGYEEYYDPHFDNKLNKDFYIK